MLRHFVLPYQNVRERVSDSNISFVSGAIHDRGKSLFTSEVRETFIAGSNNLSSPSKNLFDMLEERDLLPSKACNYCMNFKRCSDPEQFCLEYFEAVCSLNAPPKFITKAITITPPMYRRDPSRLIPRIVHQTWFEALDDDGYPNMSRLAKSFKESGWEYKFYTDIDAENFLVQHFPSEIVETYRSLIPGAFKADLFRYCALLVYGGVYADVDILLESHLDFSIAPDTGFMVGTNVKALFSARKFSVSTSYLLASHIGSNGRA
jgi:hypothetical protein